MPPQKKLAADEIELLLAGLNAGGQYPSTPLTDSQPACGRCNPLRWLILLHSNAIAIAQERHRFVSLPPSCRKLSSNQVPRSSGAGWLRRG